MKKLVIIFLTLTMYGCVSLSIGNRSIANEENKNVCLKFRISVIKSKGSRSGSEGRTAAPYLYISHVVVFSYK